LPVHALLDFSEETLQITDIHAFTLEPPFGGKLPTAKTSSSKPGFELAALAVLHSSLTRSPSCRPPPPSRLAGYCPAFSS
jgi:hypothetical protein